MIEKDIEIRLRPLTPQDVRLACLHLAARTIVDPKDRYTAAILGRAAAFEEFVMGQVAEAPQAGDLPRATVWSSGNPQ